MSCCRPYQFVITGCSHLFVGYHNTSTCAAHTCTLDVTSVGAPHLALATLPARALDGVSVHWGLFASDYCGPLLAELHRILAPGGVLVIVEVRACAL